MYSFIGAIFTVLAVVIPLYLYRVRSTLDPPIYKSPSKPLSAFVLGGTGTAGQAIVRALLENPSFEKVTIIGRRHLELPSIVENPNCSKIFQKVIDFEKPYTYAGVFKGHDIGFSALGATFFMAKKPNESYYRITHDYTMYTAKLAKAGGCRHFHYISAASASKTSFYFWAKTKAEVEEKLTALDFPRLSIYRPKYIIKLTKDAINFEDSLGIWTAKIFDPFSLFSMDSTMLGKVMVNNTFRVTAKKTEFLENSDIRMLASKDE